MGSQHLFLTRREEIPQPQDPLAYEFGFTFSPQR